MLHCCIPYHDQFSFKYLTLRLNVISSKINISGFTGQCIVMVIDIIIYHKMKKALQ